jgi:hypothetical protein
VGTATQTALTLHVFYVTNKRHDNTTWRFLVAVLLWVTTNSLYSQVDTQINRIRVLYDEILCELLRNCEDSDLNVGKVCNHPMPADISVVVILGTGAKVLHSCCKTWSKLLKIMYKHPARTAQ